MHTWKKARQRGAHTIFFSFRFPPQERAAIADADAAAFYFHDLADHNEAADTAVLESNTTLTASAVPGLPADGVAVCAVGRAAVAKGRAHGAPPNDVAIHLAVLRLPTVASDLLISVTTATRVDAASPAAERAGAGDKGGEVVSRAAALLTNVLASWWVHDWGLFGG